MSIQIVMVLMLLFGIPLATPNPREAVDQELSQLTPEEFMELSISIDEYLDSPFGDVLYYSIGDEWSVREGLRHRWRPGEIDYVAMLAHTEARNLGEVGMVSVVSTASERFTSPVWCTSGYCSRTITEEINRRNQFDGTYFAVLRGMTYEEVDRSAYLAVYKYILGYDNPNACLGFEYFNAIPDRPYQCAIQTSDGFFTNFFSTSDFERYKEQGQYRNLISERRFHGHVE